MEKKRIKILLDHGEIDPSPDFNAGSMTFVAIGEISYNMSWDVVDVAWQLFFEKIKGYVEWESDIFQGRLISKLKLYSPAIEDKVTLLRKTIIIENEKIESLNNELFKDSDKMNKDLFYPLYAEEILTPKFVGDWILREDFLGFLKFDLFKGAKINPADLPAININILDKLDGFFENDRIQTFFEIVAHTENIHYLQVKINEIENESEHSKKGKIDAPLLALFCSLINESSICKHENESKPDFCEKICERFGLSYTDRVRQNYFPVNYRRSKQITKVKDLIFPLIDLNTINTLNNFIDSKDMYG